MRKDDDADQRSFVLLSFKRKVRVEATQNASRVNEARQPGSAERSKTASFSAYYVLCSCGAWLQVHGKILEVDESRQEHALLGQHDSLGPRCRLLFFSDLAELTDRTY